MANPPDQKDLDWVETDVVFLVSWSADGRLLLGHRGTHDIYESVIIPVLWNAESRRAITPAWLEQWHTAVFSVWAVDSEGRKGHRNNWCQLAFYGG